MRASRRCIYLRRNTVALGLGSVSKLMTTAYALAAI